jgi:hypothetical protein
MTLVSSYPNVRLRPFLVSSALCGDGVEARALASRIEDTTKRDRSVREDTVASHHESLIVHERRLARAITHVNREPVDVVRGTSGGMIARDSTEAASESRKDAQQWQTKHRASYNGLTNM